MKRWQTGYTLVEAMIFLAVSTALFASIATLINGQQGKTEFANAIRDLETSIQDSINDVDAGYFPDSAASAGGLCGAGQQGTRATCIFAGKAIQFGDGADKTKYNIYTIAGNRETTGIPKKEVKNISEAMPRMISDASYTESKVMQGSLEFTKVTVGATDTFGFAILPTFGNTQTAAFASVVNNSGSAVLATMPAGSVPGNAANTSSGVTALNAASISAAAGGVKICIRDQDNDRRAVITFGGQQGSSMTTKFDQDAVTAGCP